MTAYASRAAKRLLPTALRERLRSRANETRLRLWPRAYISGVFRATLGYDMPWDNPRDLNEKINWLKLYGDTSLWPTLADKWRVREYVAARGHADMLVPLLGRWERPADIDWAALPDRFVMKMNNGSGDVLICPDKALVDTAAWTSRLARLARRPFGTELGEPHYLGIKPCVLAEELLDKSLQDAPSSSLVDYKVWCFSGEPACVWAYANRTPSSVEIGVYGTDWTWRPGCVTPTARYRLTPRPLPRPRTLEAMLHVASDLAARQPQVRVDFYEVGGRPYFGEMTLTSSAGYMDHFSREYLLELGGRVRL